MQIERRIETMIRAVELGLLSADDARNILEVPWEACEPHPKSGILAEILSSIAVNQTIGVNVLLHSLNKANGRYRATIAHLLPYFHEVRVGDGKLVRILRPGTRYGSILRVA